MRRKYIPIVLFIAFGYMITAPALLLVGVFSSTINLYIRAAEVALLMMVMVVSVRPTRTDNGVLLPLIIFFLIYSIRLLDDVLGKGILMVYQTPTYVLGYFFGLTVLPVLAIALLHRRWDTKNTFRYLLFFLVVANILLFMYALVLGDFSRGGAFSGRIQESGELEGSAVLGPIWIGISGAVLAAMLVGLLSSKERSSKTQVIISVALLCLCGANILLGASRGPVLGLAMAILIFLFRPETSIPGVRVVVSRYRAWIGTLLMIGIAAILISSSEGNVFLVDRFTSMFTDRFLISSKDGVYELRDLVYATAWQDFLSSPIFGTSYVVSFENSAAHNFILDSLISTGVFGTFFLLWALFLAVTAIQRLLNGVQGVEGVALGLGAIVAVSNGVTSGSISGTPQVWILLAFVTVAGARGELRNRIVSARWRIAR